MPIDIGMRDVIDYIMNNPIVLLAGFLLYVAVFFISIFFFGKKSGKNPFSKDHRRQVEALVTDEKARDAILKQRYKVTKVPEKVDAIIIGSGIGGLTTGAALTRAGKKVLVLEQHDQAGGCCHSFVEKGFEFDTGIHYIGNMHDGSTSRTILDQLTCGQLRWSKMDDEFDSVAIGPTDNAKIYPMKSGTARYIQNLIDMFPQEKAAIEKYMALIKDAADSFVGMVILKMLPLFVARFLVATGLYRLIFKCYRKGYMEKTLQEVLDELTSNQDLKAVLSYIIGDYGVMPKEAPFGLHAVLIHHYLSGAYYPTGGTSEIAFHMCQMIQNAGGRVLMQAPVTRILCDSKGRAIGVEVGKTKDQLFAPYIVSDAGAVNTFKTLLPEEVARKSFIYPLVDQVGPSCSFITTFIGVEGSPSELKLPAGNVWRYASNDINKELTDFMNLKPEAMEDVQVPLAYISFPSSKDPEWEKKYPGKSSILVITLGNWEWFSEWEDEKLRHRGDRYEDIKDWIGRNLWQQCVDLYPQLDGKKVYMEVGTPVTNKYYLGCPRGEMYGLDQTRIRFTPETTYKLRPDTDVPGLYLTGQDVMTCGFASALVVGLLTASKILNRNVYNDMIKLRNELRKSDSVNKSPADKKTE